MRDCVEEGILQSYVDNELPPQEAARVAEHVAACAPCREALSEATNETLILSRAFGADASLGVPTARLRERLDAAITEIESPARVKRGPIFGGWLASLGELFKVSPQRALGYASLVAVVAFAAIFAAIKLRQPVESVQPTQLVADTGNGKPGVKPPQPAASPSTPGKDDNSQENNAPDKPQQDRKPKKQVKPVYVPEPDQLPRSELANKNRALPGNKPLPGEENYLKAIDSLMVEIESGGETALKPSLRAEYERNLAVVDQAIDSTRRMARHNPKDPDAVEFLYSSYQSKLDLLTAVAEQTRPTIATR